MRVVVEGRVRHVTIEETIVGLDLQSILLYFMGG